MLLAALLLTGLTGCAARTEVVPPSPAVVAPSLPSNGLEDPARLLVRMWSKPGVFDKATLASLDGPHLFVAGWPRGLEAVNIETGFTAWMRIGDLPLDVEPTVWKGTVYLSEGGELVTLDEMSGKQLTRDSTRAGILTPVYPSESYILVGSPDERLYGVGVGTGLRQFRLNIFGYPIASDWNHEDLAFYMTSKGYLYGISIPTRNFAWEYKFKKPFCSPPTLFDDTIYVGNQDYHLYAFESVNGTYLWRTVLSGPVLGARPVATSGRVYASTSNGNLHAVDLETHETLWRVPGRKVLTTTPKHVIYQELRGEDSYIGVADTQTGEVLTLVSAIPYKLFLGSPTSGIFYAIDGKGGVLAMADREVAEALQKAKYAR
jgi:outer membrane protein assembly factor BamB